MQTPVEDGAYTQPVVGTAVLPSHTGAEEEFDLPKALNYSVANLGASLVYGLFNFGMPLYLDTYKLAPSLIGLLANERSFVGAFVQPIVGRLSDRTRTRFGRRRPFFLVGIPLMSLALIALATHPSFWVMLGIMSIAAFFLAIAWDPYMALMADLFPPIQRGRVGGLIGLGGALGNIAFALMALSLWEKNEFLVFCLVVVVLVVTWAYTFVKVKEPPVEASYAEHHKFTRPDPLAYLKTILKYPEAAKYTLAINFFWLGTGGALPFVTLFGVKVLGASPQEAFILPIAATVSNGLFAIPAGYFADRTNKKLVMTVGLLVFCAMGLIGSQAATLLQGTLALSLIGIGNAAMSQINPMLADLVPRKRMAEFIGLGSAVFSLAQPVGSVLAGAIVTIATGFVGEHEAYRWAFVFAGLMVFTSAVLLQTVHPERAVQDE